MTFIIIASAVLFSSGCLLFNSDTNRYFITVKYTGIDETKNPTNVSVIAGSDKFWWSSIESNQSKTVTLSSKKNPVTDVTLLFSLDNRERTWESGNLAESADYKIDLTIDAKGNVTQEMCQLPC